MYRCNVCEVDSRAAWEHPRLGWVCPVCLVPVPTTKAESRRRHRARKARNRPANTDWARRFTAADPGYPLGAGMPTGRTLREDGESHRQAWMRIIRQDPCAYCGVPMSGTVDHIEPQNPLIVCRGLGGVHTWLNYTAACERCNASKRDKPLWVFLRSQWGAMMRLPTKEELNASVHSARDRDPGDHPVSGVEAEAA